ncbi:MAG: type II secretion system protein [Candidatus Vogelbacteria bacterium]|nr:type II secretion system protein [Candidatus Vogelbacteria bacterium]
MTKQRRRAFTLIELLVVISIVSLLSSIVLASVSVSKKKAQNAATLSSIRQFHLWAEEYYISHDQYPVGQCRNNGPCHICRDAASSTWPPDDVAANEQFPAVIPSLLPELCLLYERRNPPNDYGLAVKIHYVSDQEVTRAEKIWRALFGEEHASCENQDYVLMECVKY